MSVEVGRTDGSNLLSRSRRLAGGWPSLGRERSAGGGGEERLAGETVSVEVIARCL